MPITGISRETIIYIYIDFIGKLLSEIQLFSTFAVTPSHLNSGKFPVTRTLKPTAAKAILRRTSNPTKS